MSKVAYTISGAARSVCLTPQTVESAVHRKELKVRFVDGQIVVLRSDIKEWLKSQPLWVP